MNNIVFQIGESYDRYKGVDDSFTKNYPKFLNKSFGFHIGAGGYFIIFDTKINLLANYAIHYVHFRRKTINEEFGFGNYFKKESSYLSLNLEKNINSKAVFLSLGCKYYFSEIKEISEFKKLYLTFGLGFQLAQPF